MSKPNVLAEPVLVGREKELEELESFLDSAIEGKGKTVFVTGEAGSGKTRLIREFLEVAKTRGVGVMAGWCLSDTQAPYFPFVEALNSYSDSGTGQEPESLNKSDLPLNAPISFHAMPEEYGIAAWLTSTEAAPKLGKPELSPQVWKDQVFAGVAKTLHGIAIQEPVIIFIDDVHWADSASLALMHYLARAIQDSERVLLLATYRTEELTSDEEGHPHPLAEIMRLMRREELFTEINLAGFDQQNVSKIATNMIGGSLQLKFAEELSAESNGNPLFIVESLRMLNERKSLIQENKEWRLAVDELGIPNKIKDIILRRLACLKYAQRRVLDAASVIGEEFDVDLLSTVLGQDYLEILETLNVVAHSTSLVRVYGNHYRFDHARSRDTLYEELAMPLKRGYHNKIAEKLESTRDQAMCLSDIAYHYVQAENKEKSLKFSLAAGQEALAKWSNTQAAQHFQYVLRTIGESPNRLSEKAAALEGLGDAYYANNNFNEAAMAFEQVADIQTGVAKLRALRKAMFAAFYLGDTPLLVRLTQKADENATADRLESARVLHQKARAILMQLDAYTCQKMLEEVLKVFEEEYALSDAAWILFANATNTARLKGEFERGVEMALRSIALYDELGDVRSQLEAYLYTAFTFEACALREDAERMYAKIVEVNEQYKMGDYVHLIPAHAYRSMNLSRVDLPGAISMALKALEYSAKTDSTLYIGFIYELLIGEYAVAEDIVRVDEYFGKLMSLPKSVLSNPFSQLYFALFMGVYYAAKNDFEKSNQYFNDELALNKKLGLNPSWEEGIRRLYAWALNRQGRAEEAMSELNKAKALVENAQERFRHTNVQASLMTFTHPEVNQPFEVRLDLTNVSRSHGSIVRVENLLVPELKVIDVSPNCFVHYGQVELKDKTARAFEVKTVKLTVKAEKPEEFHLKPSVTYIDDLGETKTSSTRLFTMTVQPVTPAYEVLPGRVTTSTAELDRILMGGIPEKYAIVLTASSSDERQQLIKRFLEDGAKNHQSTVYLTCEAGNAEEFAQRYQTNFYVVVCNLQAELVLPNLPNIIRLKGIENLTEIDIALTKLFRTITLAENQSRRICIDLILDVLLQHHAVTTRKWLSGLVAILKSQGFHVLAVIDPLVSPEEIPAITGLFDGEVRLTEKETPSGSVKTLKVVRLQGQNYLKEEVVFHV